ncbi:MAG TPA: DUF2238 domain-containing protein [Burkholderiales bacterium]|jgi:putative membrane protein|nr:DUF2238 domain-containing protein [Burkholderiales bacterium]
MSLPPPLPPTRAEAREAVILLVVVFAALSLSSIVPHDRLTWIMEALPVFIAGPILLLTWPQHRLTNLAYALITIHALILLLGAHYTYAHVPLGDWAREVFGLTRNPYDRLGHLAQGFVPAIIAREILLRVTDLRPGRMLFFIVTSICLAISALYEMIEWWSALILGQGAHEFLGTQGDPWDTQWDMFLALCGAMGAQALLGKHHNQHLRRLVER